MTPAFMTACGVDCVIMKHLCSTDCYISLSDYDFNIKSHQGFPFDVILYQIEE